MKGLVPSLEETPERLLMLSLYHVWTQQEGDHQTEILNLKNKISELKISVEDFKGNFKQTEKKSAKLKTDNLKL